MISGKPILLDGGMGQELLHRGASGDGILWSGWALSEDLAAVRDVHRDFASAGADVLTTNTYVTTRPRLDSSGAQDRFVELNEIGARVCREVADESVRHVSVAGCLPPQFASYQVELPVGQDELVKLYIEQAGILAPFCDLMIAETLSSVMECRSAVMGGETIEDLLTGLKDQMPDAILFNCTSPESVTAALSTIVDDASLPMARVDLDPATYVGHASKWLANGASIIGGCCEIGPGHIAALRELIDSGS